MIRISPHVPESLVNESLQRNLKNTLGKALHSRGQAVAEVNNWEELRDYARKVKLHTLAHLYEYLEQLERNVLSNGGHVTWAATGAEAAQFIVDLALKKGFRTLVKSKTMLGEEIGLNDALGEAGIRSIETDLGEYIIQLRGETPSHLVTPALHLSREDVSRLFVEKLGIQPTDDVGELTATARQVLREHFLDAEIGVTGANFGIAESGTIVLVENEGNARLSFSLPKTHVVIMGIEKVIPRTSDLAVFLSLLTRSAIGQRITSYVHLVNGARRAGETDGPEEFHLILVDNGRSRLLKDRQLRQTLACIRCGACLNVCPVFQSLGGHAYQSVYQGPIGAILTPLLLSPAESPDHPFASSLCGACREVCPVKIEFPEILLTLRERVQTDNRAVPSWWPEKLLVKIWAWIMSSQKRYELAGRCLLASRRLIAKTAKLQLPIPLIRSWQKQRAFPELPSRSFRELYRKGKQ
jgi:L-lactate dehydrogenase complex protein LldF